MKFKNNYPGKIWAQLDHWFQSYGQRCIKNRLLGTVLEPDQLPGSRLTGFYQLPGSENRNCPIPSLDPVKRNPLVPHTLLQHQGAHIVRAGRFRW